jgi:hypothetical protein
MKDPIRLRDDPKASPYCRGLLELGGAPQLPFQYDVDSGLERFHVAVRAETHRPSGVRRIPRVKLAKFSVRAPIYALISGFAAVAFGGSAVWIHHRHAALLARTPAAEPAPAVESRVRPRPLPRPAPARDGDAEETSETESPRSKSTPAKAPVLKTDGRIEAAREALALETSDIARLRTVARTDPLRALALAQEGAHRFPQGFFSQEREAIAIRSLVKLGHLPEARARAERFLAAYPRAPAAESIRASVGLSPP